MDDFLDGNYFQSSILCLTQIIGTVYCAIIKEAFPQPKIEQLHYNVYKTPSTAEEAMANLATALDMISALEYDPSILTKYPQFDPPSLYEVA